MRPGTSWAARRRQPRTIRHTEPRWSAQAARARLGDRPGDHRRGGHRTLFIGVLCVVEPCQRSLKAGPEILLGSGTHRDSVTCSVFYLVIYGGGFISLCTAACACLRYHTKSHEAHGTGAIHWYYSLYYKFKPKFYYWGIYAQIVLFQYVLLAFVCLQCFFWPYRMLLHNAADLTVQVAVAALVGAAGFLMPREEAESALLVAVNAVAGTSIGCACAFVAAVKALVELCEHFFGALVLCFFLIIFRLSDIARRHAKRRGLQASKPGKKNRDDSEPQFDAREQSWSRRALPSWEQQTADRCSTAPRPSSSMRSGSSPAPAVLIDMSEGKEQDAKLKHVEWVDLTADDTDDEDAMPPGAPAACRTEAGGAAPAETERTEAVQELGPSCHDKSAPVQHGRATAAGAGEDLAVEPATSPVVLLGAAPDEPAPRTCERCRTDSSEARLLGDRLEQHNFRKILCRSQCQPSPVASPGQAKRNSASGVTLEAKMAARRQAIRASKDSPKKPEELVPTWRQDVPTVPEQFHSFWSVEVVDELNVLPEEEPEFIEIEMTLDTGATVHAADRVDFPGCLVLESPGSKAGQHFQTAGKKTIPNEGQANILLSTLDGIDMAMTVQIAKISRPLLSVTKMTESGEITVLCKKDAALILDGQGKTVATFPKKGGLYICMMKYKNPKFKKAEDFPRPHE